MIQWLQRPDILSAFATLPAQMLLLWCVPRELLIELCLDRRKFSFTFKVIFTKPLHFTLLWQSCQSTSSTSSANYELQFDCWCRKWQTIMRDIILPLPPPRFLHWENITNELLQKMLNKPSTPLYTVWELVFFSEDNKLVTVCSSVV